jgi:hypothetical protein
MNKEEKLDAKIKELKECQSKNNLNSCMKCDLFLKCDLRKEYVLSAYQSMNEDMKQGGFDFN